VLPEPIEIRPHARDAGSVDTIDAPIAGTGLGRNKSGIFEHLQVLRNSRATHRKPPRQVADRAWPRRQQLE
jgi:hypothetical protein